jgi:hypothetical protein
MNPVTSQKREVLAAYARDYLPNTPSDRPDFVWETTDQIARRELGELLRPFATRPQDIPDDVVERAWSLYLLAGGPRAGLFEIPDMVAHVSPLFEPPLRDVTIGNVTFTRVDIEALLMAVVSGPETAVFGTQDRSDPLVFHQTMTDSPEKLIFDADTGKGVWNTPGKLEQRPFAGERPKEGVRGAVGNGELVQVSVVPRDPPWYADETYQAPSMSYWLELGADGQPVNGGWLSQPDFVWSSEPSSFFDRDLAIRIYQESIAPDGSGQIGQPSWWGMGTQWATLLSGRPFEQFIGLRFDEPDQIRVEKPSLEEQVKSVVLGLTHSSAPALYGMDDLKVTLAATERPKQDGFAGPAGDGELQKIEFSWKDRQSGEQVSGSLWVETKGGELVNGGWLSPVPRAIDLERWVIDR